MLRTKMMTVDYYRKDRSGRLTPVTDLPDYEPDLLDLRPTLGYPTTIEYTHGTTELRLHSELKTVLTGTFGLQGRIVIYSWHTNNTIYAIAFRQLPNGELDVHVEHM